MKNRKPLFLAVLLIPMLLLGCLKESIDDQTIVLFGEEGYIESFDTIFGMSADSVSVFPYPVLEVVNGVPTYVDQAMALSYFDGINSPDVRGEYKFDPIQVVVSEDMFEPPQYPIYFRLGGEQDQSTSYLQGQNHLIVHCDIMIPGLDWNSTMFRTDTAYVKGNGSHLLVYMQREQEVQAPISGRVLRYKFSQGIAISGDRAGGKSDITNAFIAFYTKKVKIVNPEDFSNEVLDAIQSMEGRLVIYRDADGVTQCSKGQPFINWNK